MTKKVLNDCAVGVVKFYIRNMFVDHTCTFEIFYAARINLVVSVENVLN